MPGNWCQVGKRCLGNSTYRVEWPSMVPTLEAATNPRVNADSFIAACAASASRTEWAYAARELSEATTELPKRLAGKQAGDPLPPNTGFVAALRGKGYDAAVMRAWLGWALGRFGMAAALLMPVRSVDPTLPRTLNRFGDDGGRSFDGYVELALSLWPVALGAQPPSSLLRLMRQDNPSVGDVLESLAALNAFGAAIKARQG